MKIYKSKKDCLTLILFIAIIILTAMVFIMGRSCFMSNPFALLLLMLPTLLILWIYFDTYYIIEDRKLKYHSAFLNGEIEIKNIREVIYGKMIWVGIKPALARNGLIIKFNKYDEIYISPINNDEMISDLMEFNPDIEVVKNQ